MKGIEFDFKVDEKLIKDVVRYIGAVTILFHMILSVRNIYQMVTNINFLLDSSSTLTLAYNFLMYLVIIVIGFESFRKFNNLYYMILALVAIIVIL